jgi:transcription elongation factor Elf1
MNESLESLFGDDEARVAEATIVANESSIIHRVKSIVLAHSQVFSGKPEEARRKASELAEIQSAELAHQRHHRIACPACESSATVQGTVFGPEITKHEPEGIKVRQAVYPTSFFCQACGLRLSGYAELSAAGLGGHYTRTTTYSPEEYYGLIDPDNFDPTPFIEDYLRDIHDEYDNE